jgi:GNAT superfamily N-acetyltransferase
VLIQRLRPDESDRLRSIRLRALREAPEAFATTFAEACERPSTDWGQQLVALANFVAVLEGRDVGLVRGAPFEGRTGAAILLSMWVAPEARGRGAGEGLIHAVAEWARARGFERLLLDVADDNAKAIALYARMGFEPTGATGALPPPREHVREHERALWLGPRPTSP